MDRPLCGTCIFWKRKEESQAGDGFCYGNPPDGADTAVHEDCWGCHLHQHMPYYVRQLGPPYGMINVTSPPPPESFTEKAKAVLGVEEKVEEEPETVVCGKCGDPFTVGSVQAGSIDKYGVCSSCRLPEVRNNIPNLTCLACGNMYWNESKQAKNIRLTGHCGCKDKESGDGKAE